MNWDFWNLYRFLKTLDYMVGARRLELRTHWLRVSCSTNWATRPSITSLFIWYFSALVQIFLIFFTLFNIFQSYLCLFSDYLKRTNRINHYNGAGDGNRTRVIGLEGRCSTIELLPHWSILNKLTNLYSSIRGRLAKSIYDVQR